MKFISLELKGYLPLSHCGTDYFKAEFPDICTALLGNNGSGKSSILRTLTPYPEIRTDYAKNGYCTKIIEHEGHTFILGSDFKNASKAHSFIMDGKEQNESGATEVQEELCNSYFQFNSILEKLTAGKYKICDMKRSERKDLFFATYPSDMSFVMEAYKKVRSQINAFNNNLKMLKEREGAIRAKLINTDQLKELKKYKKQLDDLNGDIDKLVFIIEQDKQKYLSEKQYADCYQKYRAGEMRTAGEIMSDLITIRDSALEIRRNNPNKFTDDNFQMSQRLKEAEIDNLEREINQAKTIISDLTKTLDEYERINELNVEDELIILQAKRENLTNALNALPTEMVGPLLSAEQTAEISRTFMTLHDLCTFIHGLGAKVWSAQQVNNVGMDITLLTHQINQISLELGTIQSDIEKLKIRQNNEDSYQYPSSCNLSCKLKESVQKMHQKTTDELIRHQEKEKELASQSNKLTGTLNQLKNDVLIPRSARPKIDDILIFLQGFSLVKFVLNDESLETVLNRDPYEITNKVKRVIDCNAANLARIEYTKDLMVVDTKIAALRTAQAAAKELKLISKTIYDNRVKLESTSKKYLSDLQKIKNMRNDWQSLSILAEHAEKLESLFQEYSDLSKAAWVASRIEFDNKIIQDQRDIKQEISEKLREMEATISDQDNLITRLNDEILPTSKSITDSREVWIAVEAGLSPTSGFPHVYMVQYINQLITLVNQYISSVWYYDMELVYLDASKPIDYDIRVMINKNSIIKDLNMLSDGQKAMVSLAFTLAICIHRKYADVYPLKMDEVDPALTENHRIRLTGLISDWLQNRKICQLFMVNHFVVHTGMTECGAICLSTEGIVLPPVYNLHAEIR